MRHRNADSQGAHLRARRRIELNRAANIAGRRIFIGRQRERQMPVGGQRNGIGRDLRTASSRTTTGIFTACAETLLMAMPVAVLLVLSNAMTYALALRLSSGTTASCPLGL